MLNKKKNRLRRCRKIRFIWKKFNKIRLVIYKTSCHIYAQIIKQEGKNSNVLVFASTLEKKIINNNNTGNIISASIIGKVIAKRSINKGIYNVVFDRSGFKYHGRIKKLANNARKYGLIF